MSFVLRSNEKIVADGKFHWSSYLLTSVWALFGLLPLVGILKDQNSTAGLMLSVCVFVFGPLVYRFTSNKTRRYVITNQRFYMQAGIFSKNLIELPLAKINDISFRQSLLQRILGTGTLVILTGNSKPTLVHDIDDAISFRELLAKTASKQSA